VSKHKAVHNYTKCPDAKMTLNKGISKQGHF